MSRTSAERLLAEDGAQRRLRSQLGLRLRRNLTHQNVTGVHLGPDAHDAIVAEVRQRIFRNVGNITRDLLIAYLVSRAITSNSST